MTGATWAPERADNQEPSAFEGQHATMWTVENAAYVGLALVGVIARLAALGRFPLLESEADTALAAWRTVQGSPWRPSLYVPLLYDLDLVLFFLTRASDAVVRLLPALVGAALVGLPFLLRDLLGRRGALAVAAILTFSPTWLHYSRTADGTLLGWAAGAALLLCLYRLATAPTIEGAPDAVGNDGCDGRRRYARGAAIAAGLGLTTGATFYSALALLLVGSLVWYLATLRSDQKRAAPWAAILPRLNREDGLVFLGLFLLLGSGLLANLGGIGVSISQAGEWVRQLAPSSSGLTAWAQLRALLSYEPITVTLAAVGLIVGFIRRQRIDRLLLAWFVYALLLTVLLGHRHPMWLPDVLLPLLLLAGRGFEFLWQELADDAQPLDLVATLVLLSLMVFGLIEIANYIQNAQDKFVGYARIGWGIAIILWGAYWYIGRGRGAWRALALLVLTLAVGYSVRVSTAVAYQTARDPRESLVYQPTSIQMLTFADSVSELSSRMATDPLELEIDYTRALDPWVGWYLRDMRNLRLVDGIEPGTMREALVTLPRAEGSWPAGYVGQRFRWQESFPSQSLTDRQQLRWIMYRDPVGTEQASEVELWVRIAE